METQIAIRNLPATFTCTQWTVLLALQRRYRRDRDLWSEWERAQLRFVRWLYQTGRVVP